MLRLADRQKKGFDINLSTYTYTRHLFFFNPYGRLANGWCSLNNFVAGSPSLTVYKSRLSFIEWKGQNAYVLDLNLR